MSEEDIFKLLGSRLALSRLKRSQLNIKQQKILDNFIRDAKYIGYNINQGAIVDSTEGRSTKQAISSGLIIPNRAVKLVGNSADWLKTTKIEAETPKVPIPGYFGIVAVPGSINACRIAFCEAQKINVAKKFEPNFHLFLGGSGYRVEPLFSYDSIFNSQFWFASVTTSLKYLNGLNIKKNDLVPGSKSTKLTEFNLPVTTMEYEEDLSIFKLLDGFNSNKTVGSYYSKVIKYIDSKGNQRLCCILGDCDSYRWKAVFIWDMGSADAPSTPKNICCYLGMGFARRSSIYTFGGFFGIQVKGAYGTNKGIVLKLFVFDGLEANEPGGNSSLDYEIFISEEHLQGESGNFLTPEKIVFSDKINTYIFRWLRTAGIPTEMCDERNGFFYVKQKYIKTIRTADLPQPLNTREPYLIKSYKINDSFPEQMNSFQKVFLTDTPSNLFYYVSAAECLNKKFIFS